MICSCISEEELSPDEVRLLEAENAELLAEFQTAKDSVKLIETKVVRIAELQVCMTVPAEFYFRFLIWHYYQRARSATADQ